MPRPSVIFGVIGKPVLQPIVLYSVDRTSILRGRVDLRCVVLKIQTEVQGVRLLTGSCTVLSRIMQKSLI